MMMMRRPRATGAPEESAERRSGRWLKLWCSAPEGQDVALRCQIWTGGWTGSDQRKHTETQRNWPFKLRLHWVMTIWGPARDKNHLPHVHQSASFALLTGLSLADDAAVDAGAADLLPGPLIGRAHDSTALSVGVVGVPVGEGHCGAVQPGHWLPWKWRGEQQRFIVRLYISWTTMVERHPF